MSPRRVPPWPGISEQAETVAYAILTGDVGLDDLLDLCAQPGNRWVADAVEELFEAGMISVDPKDGR